MRLERLGDRTDVVWLVDHCIWLSYYYEIGNRVMMSHVFKGSLWML